MFPDNDLPQELSDLVDGEMAKGERPIWVGQPIAWRYARAGWPAVLFGIPWTAFAVFWMFMAGGGKIPDFSQWVNLFPFFGLPFVLIGVLMLTTPYWMLRKARRTVYAVTDRRALLIEGHVWGGVTIRSFGPEWLSDLKRTQFADGSGHLIFERRVVVSNEGSKSLTEVGFMAIPDVKAVEELILELSRNGEDRRD